MAQIPPEHALKIGYQHHASGRLPEAEKIYRQVLAQQPNHPQALHLLGLLAQDTGHREDALKLIRRSLEIQPSEQAYLNCAFLLEEMGRAEEAVASYQAGLQLNPNVAEAQSNLGNLLNHLG